jgi:hypothetical protein
MARTGRRDYNHLVSVWRRQRDGAGLTAWPRSRPTALVLLSAVGLLAGCGVHHPATSVPRNLAREARPIGVGTRFHPPATGLVVGPCLPQLGSRFGVHVEVFAENRVVLLPAGIGTLTPRSTVTGRIRAARCYGNLVTLEPTGVVLVRPRLHLPLSDVFRSWGEPLSATRVASFSASPGEQVVVFVNGRRWRGAPGSVPLDRHAEIVVEVGPLVPPHASYSFPPGT